MRACVLAAAISAAGLVLAPQAARAQNVVPAVLAGSCFACHGPDGASPGAIPAIPGLPAADFATLLRSFKTAGSEVTVMNRIARGYTDTEIDALAGFFAALKR